MENSSYYNTLDWAALGRLYPTPKYRNVGKYFVVVDELKHRDVRRNVELSEIKR